MKCASLHRELDEQHADDNDDDACKIESAQPISDTFCEPVPQLPRKLQLEHHQCARLLKAVYGLVNAPRRLYHRVATDLRNMRSEESLMEPCWWAFLDESGVIHALSLIYVDDLMLSCSDSSCGRHVFDSINNLFKWRTGSHECSQCGARITQAYDKHTRTWRGFETSFTEHAKQQISLITLPSHQRRDRKSRITPLELSQLGALNGQLLWLYMQCAATIAGASVTVDGTTPQATVDTIYEVNKLARKSDCVGQIATQSLCSSFSCSGHVHRCWMDHSTRRHFARVTAGLHRKRRVVAKQRIEHVSGILAFESSETGGKIVICSRSSSSSTRR